MSGPNPVRRAAFFAAIEKELERAYAKHGTAPWSRHEFYAILLEEVDEVWGEIKVDGQSCDLEAEIVQVAAMCLRYVEVGSNSANRDYRP